MEVVEAAESVAAVAIAAAVVIAAAVMAAKVKAASSRCSRCRDCTATTVLDRFHPHTCHCWHVRSC